MLEKKKVSNLKKKQGNSNIVWAWNWKKNHEVDQKHLYDILLFKNKTQDSYKKKEKRWVCPSQKKSS